MALLSLIASGKKLAHCYRPLAMSKGDLSVIDTDQWKPVQSPGLKAPRHQVPYDSQEVQKILAESFGVMFPSIVQEERSLKRYVAVNKRDKNVMPAAKPVKNINDIPKAEMMRLMEGWIRLRRKLQEGGVPTGVSAILLNFRVPNPRQSLDRYMLYPEGDEKRLIIRWGYETKESPAVSLERAISILMDVPLGHMRSILSTSMSPATSTVPVGPMIASAAAAETHGRKMDGGAAGGKKVVFGMVAASVVVFSLGIYGISKAFSVKDQQAREAVQQPLFVEPQAAEERVETVPQEAQVEETVVLAPVVVQEEQPAPQEKVEAVAKVEPAPSLDSALIHAPEKKSPVDLGVMLDGGTSAVSSSSKSDKDLSLDGMLEEQQSTDLLGDMMQ